jgi:hypothetical protein
MDAFLFGREGRRARAYHRRGLPPRLDRGLDVVLAGIVG